MQCHVHVRIAETQLSIIEASLRNTVWLYGWPVIRTADCRSKGTNIFVHLLAVLLTFQNLGFLFSPCSICLVMTYYKVPSDLCLCQGNNSFDVRCSNKLVNV